MGKHTQLMPDGRYVWYTERLWRLSENFPVKLVSIEEIPEFEQNCWFDAQTLPSCKNVALHAKRIYESDLSFPIILSAEGNLMDGGHRIAKAWLMNIKEIKAIQFDVTPEPDEIRAE